MTYNIATVTDKRESRGSVDVDDAKVESRSSGK